MALAECPSAAKAAGLTAAQVKDDQQAATDAQIMMEQAGHLAREARAAREAAFVEPRHLTRQCPSRATWRSVRISPSSAAAGRGSFSCSLLTP